MRDSKKEKPINTSTGVQETRSPHRWYQWTRHKRNLLTMLVVLLMPCCCCQGYAYFTIENVPARVVMRYTMYPGTEVVFRHSWVGGSSLVHHYEFMYWTDEAVSDVIDHYERFFPDFKQVDYSYALKVHEHPVVFESIYRPVGISIYVEDAAQRNRRFDSWCLIPIPDDVPYTGTVILITVVGDFAYD